MQCIYTVHHKLKIFAKSHIISSTVLAFIQYIALIYYASQGKIDYSHSINCIACKHYTHIEHINAYHQWMTLCIWRAGHCILCVYCILQDFTVRVTHTLFYLCMHIGLYNEAHSINYMHDMQQQITSFITND